MRYKMQQKHLLKLLVPILARLFLALLPITLGLLDHPYQCHLLRHLPFRRAG